MKGPVVGVLAVQGAFAEHELMLEQLGCTCMELRQARDLATPFDALVLPGGESTTQSKLLHELGMFDALKQRIASGMPVLGTCAGLILLAQQVEEKKHCAHVEERRRNVHEEGYRRSTHGDSSTANDGCATEDERDLFSNKNHLDVGETKKKCDMRVEGFHTLPIAVQRNAYGRQLGSFHTRTTFEDGSTAPLTFIRAPRITRLLPDAHGIKPRVLARVDDMPVAVRYGNQFGVAFHPELDESPYLHRLFLSSIA